eukprot:CAMPEP_0172822420 /NCGR_PEP_ID=MMETSP1075-20121228/16666_1 /TAXON_ID=2916 /ORGANISM="Ceratium fusus, Strain PA161109" /LENGTH=321 /DNA_ID=CAMNT_0013663409 /DNA_START=48 /DNA_END=1013 /DNA_ORIENTATION=-
MVIRTGACQVSPDLAIKFRQQIPRDSTDTSRTNSSDLVFDVAMSVDTCETSSVGSESEGLDSFPVGENMGLSFSRQSTEFVEGGLNSQSGPALEAARQDTKAQQPSDNGTVSSPSSPNRARMRNKFYKIKMCHFVSTGTCKKINTCSFAHSPEELLPMPDLRNTKACPNLLRDGTCEDQDCRYAHATDELRNFKQAKELTMQREQQPMVALHGLKPGDTIDGYTEEPRGAFAEAQQEAPLGANCCVRNTFFSWGPASLTESLQLQDCPRRGSSLPNLKTAERHSFEAEQRVSARMSLDSDHAWLQRLGENVQKLRQQFPAK